MDDAARARLRLELGRLHYQVLLGGPPGCVFCETAVPRAVEDRVYWKKVWSGLGRQDILGRNR
jgi:hypothetical protein